MKSERTFVIVGAGQAGGRAAETLRGEGFDGRIVLIGEEDERPYERPPLSKDFLLPGDDKPTIQLHDPDWYADNSVELLSGRRVADVDRSARRVSLADGERIGYDSLLLATGAVPRKLDVPGAELTGVHYLRRVGDSKRLAEVIADGVAIVVVGAGWIGLETAAAARAWGCDVTVVEPQPTPLRAPLGSEMGEYFAGVHRDHGVTLLTGRGVTGVTGHEGAVTGVTTDQGTTIPADAVIVAVGVDPNTALAERCGLSVDNGIVVDASLRTADPGVFAAGDAANAFHPRYGCGVRVEHWDTADNQSVAAAKSMLGRDVAYERLPYFFTDQYDIGMEFTGWFPPGGYDTVVTRGDVAANAFAAFWLADSKVVAGMHINLWDDGIDPIGELVASGQAVDSDRLADPAVPLGSVTSRA